MKVLITTEFYLPFRCGVTVAVMNLKKALEKRGHEVRVLTIGSNKESFYEDGIYYIKSNLPQFYKDSYATLAFGGEIFKDIIKWKPDIVHSQCEFFTMVYAKRVAKKLHIPLVHTCHTDFDSYRIHFTGNVRLWNFMTHTFIPRLLKKAKYLICPTDKMERVLRGYGVLNPIALIPSGLDLERYDEVLSKEEKHSLRFKYDISDDAFVFVSICRLSEEKNVSGSLRAFKALHDKYAYIRFLIVGDGDYSEELRKEAFELGIDNAVSFTGSVPMEDVWKYYQLCDMFISSSDSETQGLTYFEALASGIPVICHPDEALMSFLSVGKNGYVFNDEKEFVEIMEKIITNQNLYECIKNNSKSSIKDYSLDVFGERICNIYDKVL